MSWPDGVFLWGPHVAGINVPLRADLEAEFRVPVIADNDANNGALGRKRVGGAARGHDHVLLVTLGTGIGGAIADRGAPLPGRRRASPARSVTWPTNKGRLQCACGKLGCWETVASGPALVRLASAAVADNPDSTLAHRLGGDSRFRGEDVTRAADAGDEIARSLVAQVGRELGVGLCSLIAVLDPGARDRRRGPRLHR